MKKLVSVIALLLCVLALSGCAPKSAITADMFVEAAKDLDLTITDATDQFEGQAKSVIVAGPSELSYQVEFFVVEDVAQAVVAFNLNKADVELQKGPSSSTSSSEMQNWQRYTQTSNGKYSVISRIDNTFVYANVDEQYKEDVNALLKTVGY